MPRAVVLPSLARAAAAARHEAQEEEEHSHYATRGAADDAAAGGDEFAARLVKYIPAEALAFFLASSSARSTSDGLVIALLIAGCLGATLWALNRNARLAVDERQPVHFLVFYTLVAFAAWSLGTSRNVQELFDWSQQTCAVAMTIVAFLLPAVDDMIMRRRLQRQSSTG